MAATQQKASRLTPQLQARSAWAWPQALVWSFLGVALLNACALFGAILGLAVYGLIGVAARSCQLFRLAERWRAPLVAAKWILAAAAFGLCVLAGLKPDFVSQADVLAPLFRPSAAFPSTTFYGGWPGEPVITSGLLLLAFGQAVLNELNFSNDFLGGAQLGADGIPDRTAVLRGLAGGLSMTAIAVLAMLVAGMSGDTGPRGHAFDARIGPMWAFAWWAILSFSLLGLRFVRLAAASLTLLREQRPS